MIYKEGGISKNNDEQFLICFDFNNSSIPPRFIVYQGDKQLRI